MIFQAKGLLFHMILIYNPVIESRVPLFQLFKNRSVPILHMPPKHNMDTVAMPCANSVVMVVM